ncbi:hypothetical protein CANTEDRAFT_97577 [Yamadazyma tenuis ATCC 10573]|uniref:Threonyl/alanyl tRNA synthetase SAD domain-containing protein n=1 Tax=Candida tenuis (strain ATCC 10573 / BCRC 21748 / CBS 615 / JCM 9827 / NBRC 10315 / NRRL Y-1498 / VKM Y-70) TaxID=590646 RepID=G3B2N7_CANTC|nr:uncharacterized protein CANTEDRAFT_97577 [Yamadazyma tenuis ATCC 10573]EGV65107.1 hypothetical protein CANTEDRAFT_97577 [Yamadazyma tenuis ATCC 10573]
MGLIGSTIVGALACQKESFLKTLATTVCSCEPHKGHITPKDKQNKNKKKKDSDASNGTEVKYAIELADTVIFPEGGGQPCDQGFIKSETDEVFVSEAIREGLTALHLSNKPLVPGTKVNVSMDWARRFDHMQQHTGQHLVSAIFDQYDLETLSWGMGDVTCYVELPKKVDEELVNEVNQKVNQAILDAIPITVEVPDGHGHELDLSHLPDDYDISKGLVRIVSIGNLDRNPCCGTHLKNTSQIQAVSILNQVNVRGGNSRVHFVCGSRVYKFAQKNYDILKNVSGGLLSCQPDEVYEKTKLLNDNYREANSTKNNLLKELMGLEAKRMFESFKNGSTLEWAYRKDTDAESLNLLQKELLTLVNNNKDSGIDLDKTHTAVMFTGLVNEPGTIKIMGPESTELSGEIKKILSTIKGGGKGSSFQGKISKYEKGEIDSLVNYLNNFRLHE